MYSDRATNTMTGKGRLMAGLVICLLSMSVGQSVPDTTKACKIKEQDDKRHNKILLQQDMGWYSVFTLDKLPQAYRWHCGL